MLIISSTFKSIYLIYKFYFNVLSIVTDIFNFLNVLKKYFKKGIQIPAKISLLTEDQYNLEFMFP